jgi:hypothetical protein
MNIKELKANKNKNNIKVAEIFYHFYVPLTILFTLIISQSKSSN